MHEGVFGPLGSLGGPRCVISANNTQGHLAYSSSLRPQPGRTSRSSVYVDIYRLEFTYRISHTVLVLVPYPRNDAFVPRPGILEKLEQLPSQSTSQARVSLFGLGGIG